MPFKRVDFLDGLLGETTEDISGEGFTYPSVGEQFSKAGEWVARPSCSNSPGSRPSLKKGWSINFISANNY
jgi:hypothetical protein